MCESGDAETLAKLKDQLLRLQADFENARKRWRKEQAEIQERATGDLLGELLDIHDDFERALEASSTVHPEGLEGGTVPARPSTEPAPDSIGGSGRAASEFRTGVEMIARRMEDFLKSYGVVRIEALGKPFDPAWAEAVAHEERTDLAESTVLEELRKGYLMNGRVLRPAVVKVAVKPENREQLPQQGASPGETTVS